jgi:opacity protein-like surface antigen
MRMKTKLVAGMVLATILLSASHALGECTIGKGSHEWGLMAGFGDNVHIHNNVREDVEFHFLIPHWGTVVREWEGCRSLQFNLEGFLDYSRQDSGDRYAFGVTPVFRFNFPGAGRVVPFVEAGVGVLHTDLDPDGFGSSFAFTPQGGAGIRYELSRKTYLTLSYRFHHISNAGIDSDNASIDSHFFMVGVSVVR